MLDFEFLEKGLGIVSPSHFASDFSQKIFLTLYILLTDKVIAFTYWHMVTPSRQILVPRTSLGRPPPTSPGRPLKILFDRPGNVPIWHPGDVLKWRPGDVLIWRSRDVPGRLIRDVPRTFSGRPLEDLQSTQTWMSKFFFNFSFRTYSIDQI